MSLAGLPYTGQHVKSAYVKPGPMLLCGLCHLPAPPVLPFSAYAWQWRQGCNPTITTRSPGCQKEELKPPRSIMCLPFCLEPCLGRRESGVCYWVYFVLYVFTLPNEKNPSFSNNSQDFSFLFFNGFTCDIWKFPVWGWDKSHCCDLHHSCSNTGSFNPLNQDQTPPP